MAASIETAKPLFHQLKIWRERLPLGLNEHSLRETTLGVGSPYPATIYHAYLTLVVYVWRALLRTTVRSAEPPQVIHVEDPIAATGFDPTFIGDFGWGDLHRHYPEMDFRPSNSRQESSSTMVGELYEAALNCAGTVIEFVSKLACAAFSEFWYSCKTKSNDTMRNRKHPSSFRTF